MITRSWRTVACIAALLLVSAAAGVAMANETPVLRLLARSRVPVAPNSEVYAMRETPLQWDPNHTAIIICDMWNRHWCRGAEARQTEIAIRMNRLVSAAGRQGVFIVHAPSDVMDYYKVAPQRKLAQAAPADPKVPVGVDDFGGPPAGEPALPIDDGDGGCDCQPTCRRVGTPWNRQTDLIQIGPDDAISDSAREMWNLFTQRGIENVILMGINTNLCVLGRPFGLRQWAAHGKTVVLARDLTDTCYNPARPPHVSHRRGTELVIEHIEKYVCPSIALADALGEPAPPHVVFLIGEDEYKTGETLPAFVDKEFKPRGVRTTFVLPDPEDHNHFPNIKALSEADLLVLSVRRRVLPPDEIAAVHKYLDAGRPLVGIRTASHAFQGKTLDDENAAWRTFDVDVLGAHYLGHHSNGGREGSAATLYNIVPEQAGHPILSGLDRGGQRSGSSLYKNQGLAATVTVLMRGHVEGQNDHDFEPVAWTNTYHGARIFYTSLGGPTDFENPAFRRLLLNAIYWGLDRQVPQAGGK